MCNENCKRIIGPRISYGSDILIDSGLSGSGSVKWALRMWKGFSRLRIVPVADFRRQSWNEFRDYQLMKAEAVALSYIDRIRFIIWL
jgi:hypothetical protein